MNSILDTATSAEPPTKGGTILEVDSLKMHFPITRGLFKRKVGEVRAVDGVSFSCGGARPSAWSARADAARRPWAGAYAGSTNRRLDTSGSRAKRYPLCRRRSSDRFAARSPVIFQDPYGSLDPGRPPAASWASLSRCTRWSRPRRTTRKRVGQLFTSVGLNRVLAGAIPMSSAAASGSGSASHAPWPATPV